MLQPIFLTLNDVLQFHADQVEQFGGGAGNLDLRKLEAALAQPAMTFEGRFLHEDLAAMAAAYLYHIVQNHPFVDGNKRTGANAAIVFLELNGCPLEFPLDETEALVVAVASGKATKDDVARFFRKLMEEQQDNPSQT